MPRERLSLSRRTQRILSRRVLQSITEVSASTGVSTEPSSGRGVPNQLHRLKSTRRRTLTSHSTQLSSSGSPTAGFTSFADVYSSTSTLSSSECFSTELNNGLVSHKTSHSASSKIQTQIANWSIGNNIGLKATTELLKILKSHQCFQQLPADSRSLLKTPRHIPVKSIDPGQYIHFGVEPGIRSVIRAVKCKDITLQINIDGIPVSRSSSQQFWPILGYVSSVPNSNPFTIGIYFGRSKPSVQNEYLIDFVHDLKQVIAHGLLWNGQTVKVSLDCFVCDAPARAYICNIKGHTGYFGCGKCVQEGSYLENRVVFLESGCALRTNNSFRTRLQEEHHLGTTVLEQLPLNLVDQFPFEFMHLVCLGVTRKLINLWVKGKLSRFRLPPSEVRRITCELLRLKPYVPVEFSRKPRAVQFLDTWKATEFRQFLLYTGPVVLKAVLPNPYYSHFMSLHFAVSLLCGKHTYKKYNAYANSLLKYFVDSFPKLYGKEQMSYNVHGLVHLATDAYNLGPLDTYSAFRFENHLGVLKRTLNSTNRPLEQIYNRISERNSASSFTPVKIKCVLKFSHCNGPTLRISGEQYSYVALSTFILRVNTGNNCCQLVCGSIIEVQNIIQKECGQVLIIGSKFLSRSLFYSDPSDSRILGIEKVSNPTPLNCWPLEQVQRKCILFPSNTNTYFCFPLIHADQAGSLKSLSS